MKYGLIVNIGTDNIGDDIQSYAARQFLPSVDYVIDREAMDTFDSNGETVKAIMNGWYMYNKANWPPASAIQPLWVAVHISKNDYFGIGERFLDGVGGDYLRHYAPIGARDVSTMEMLERNHIPAFLSGCLTLTLPRFDGVAKTDEVLLVDVDQASEEKIRRLYPEERIQCVTHSVNAEEYSQQSIEERFQRVEQLMKRYQGAKCVITSRLHCALPCLALQTPVFLIYKSDYAPRMQSFLNLLHYSALEDLEHNIQQFCVERPQENKHEYVNIRNQLVSTCRSFIENETRQEPYHVSLETLHSWQKELLNSSEFFFRTELDRQASWIQQLEDGKRYLQEQCERREQRIDELQQWNRQLESGKDYLEKQVTAKDTRIHELEEWTKQLEDAKSYLEEQTTAKDNRISELEAWCQEVTNGKNYVEKQWNMEKEDRKAAEEKITELSQKLSLLLGDEKIQKIIVKRKYKL